MAIFEIQHILSWINMKNFASTILSFSRLLLNTVRETWTARGSIGKNKANIYNSGTKCRYSVTRGGSTTLHQKLPILNGDSGSFDFHVIEIVLPFSFFFSPYQRSNCIDATDTEGNETMWRNLIRPLLDFLDLTYTLIYRMEITITVDEILINDEET